MTPIDWAILPLKKYATFAGRAPRAEYWWYMVASGLLGLLLDYIDGLSGEPVVGLYGPLSLIVTVALLVPGLAVTIRRLHDIGRSGWWVLLSISSYLFVFAGFVGFTPETMDGFGQMSPAVLVALVVAWCAAAVLMLGFTVTRGTDGSNRFGPDPYEPGSLEEVFA